jgi:hypothetical protein
MGSQATQGFAPSGCGIAAQLMTISQFGSKIGIAGMPLLQFGQIIDGKRHPALPVAGSREDAQCLSGRRSILKSVDEDGDGGIGPVMTQCCRRFLQRT